MMWLALHLFLVTWIQPSTPDGADTVPESMLDSWKSAILEEVTYLKKQGTPGKLITFGPRSFPLVLGASIEDAVVAAAELGSGKIVYVTEDDYVNDVTTYKHGCKDTSDPRGLQYTGTLSVTKTGKTCQRWDSDTPHSHINDQAEFFPDDTMDEVANHCRNPSSKEKTAGLWCYTTDPDKTSEHCIVPTCPDDPGTDTGNVYKFQQNVLKWLSQGSATLDNVCDITSEDDDLSCLDDENIKVAILTQEALDAAVPSPDKDAKLSAWIKGGGGLFLGFSGNRWHSNRDKLKPWINIPFYSVLMEAGIALETGAAKDQSGQFKTDTLAADLHVLSLPYTETIDEISDLDNLGDYMTYMINIMKDSTEIAYPLDFRKKIALRFVDFIKGKEAEMQWPSCEEEPVPCDSAMEAMYNLYSHIGFMGLWKDKYHDLEPCPGDVPADAERVSTIVTVTSESKEFWATGHYLAAGDTMTVTVLSTDDDTWVTFTVVVNMHTDILKDKDELTRMPRITSKTVLQSITTEIVHPWGGLIVLLSPAEQAYIKVHISGVVKAPYYKLDDEESMNGWLENRHNPAPWAELEGELMTFYLPASELKDVEDPGPALRKWDNIVKTSWDLTARPMSHRRRMSAMMDVQISLGFLHSGWPIMATMKDPPYGESSMDTWVMNIVHDTSNFWGMYHEIGHNNQRKEWTFSGYSECTVNIFSMLSCDTGMQDPLGKNVNDWYNKRRDEQVVVDIIMGKDYSPLSSGAPWTALLIYAQLYRVFGWGCYKEVFKGYEYDRMNDDSKLPDTSDQVECLNQWVERWNDVVQYDLCPLFELWAYPVTVCDDQPYTPYLPTDDLTQKEEIASRVDEIATKYPDLLRELPEKPACWSPTYYDRKELELQIQEAAVAMNNTLLSFQENLQSLPSFEDLVTDENRLVGKLRVWRTDIYLP